jgi:hypothetical protein
MNDYAVGVPQALGPTSSPTFAGLTITGTATFASTVTATGQFLAGDGSAAAPSYSFASDTAQGMFRTTAGFLGFADGGAILGGFRTGVGFFVCGGGSISFTASTTDLSSSSLDLYRDASDVFAQRRATNSQEFRLYDTYTDASNYRRLGFSWTGGITQILPATAGTGTAGLNGLDVGYSGTKLLRFATANATLFGLNLLFGLSSIGQGIASGAIAWDAHLGGFAAGLVLFSLFDPVQPTPRSP